MKYKCAKCNHANERKPEYSVMGKAPLAPCDKCGCDDLFRAERARSLTTNEVIYRIAGILFTLNSSTNKFEIYAK